MDFSLFDATVRIDDAFVDAPPDALRRELREYARGERRTFDVAVAYPDDFTGDVMRAMTEIPYDETRTYGALARDLDTSAVAVGGACARNPVPVVVPCHRVVASDGGLRGYSGGDGVDTKRRLLEHETRNVEGDDGTRQSTLPGRD
ncbi:methylated-DNA--[protein]-cysteine S-methyltransferase [Halorubellus litoreus]|uniref:methylated-DNA--[protein]-cysteine S-methyltransferase n=1 Tax=Halorubellus litoreus TaxID=755308 RepID=A0ABD5VIT3_9EURY